MNGRDESFLVSIFRKATGKKVDEIVAGDGEGGAGEGERDTAVCDFSPVEKFGFRRKTRRDALTSSRCERRLI